MLSNITFKHRIIGAIFLVSLAVILIPAFFDSPNVDTLAGKESLPEAPELAQGDTFTKIEYSFTELLTDPEETPAAAVATLTQEDVSVTPLTDDETAVVATEAVETAMVEAVEEPADVPVEPVTTTQRSVITTAEKLITENAWAVQLGAFTKPENAQNLLSRLQQEGYTAYTELMPQTQLTRVLVGSEANRVDAAELLAKLDETMHLKGIIVKLSP